MARKTRKTRKTWVRSRPSKANVPEHVKTEIQQKATALVNDVLKPTYIKPPPEDTRWNYLVDIYSKWYRSYFYFCTKYHCPDPNAISEYFEEKFARMEYVSKDSFTLSYMRHTGKWHEVAWNLSAEECFASIKDDPMFQP